MTPVGRFGRLAKLTSPAASGERRLQNQDTRKPSREYAAPQGLPGAPITLGAAIAARFG